MCVCVLRAAPALLPCLIDTVAFADSSRLLVCCISLLLSLLDLLLSIAACRCIIIVIILIVAIGVFLTCVLQAYLTGQLQAIGKWLKKGCEEKGRSGSILTVAATSKWQL